MATAWPMAAWAGFLLLLVPMVNGQCDLTAADALTPPTGLTHSMADGDTVADGATLAFTCDAANNDYLSDGNAHFDVTCSGTAFTDPGSG